MNSNPSLAESLPTEQGAQSIFSGPWLRWSQLTQAERFVCAFIILTPIWWLIGWTYNWFLLTGAVLSYQQLRGKGFGLKRPSLLVISGFSFHIYKSATSILNSSEVKPSVLIGVVVGVCFYFIIWFIESNDVRLRVEAVAWAISILVLEILIVWVAAQLVLRTPQFVPPRTLLSQFLDRSERYIKGAGASNYLLLYSHGDKLPGGFTRFSFFYPVPEDFGLISSCISLFALDIKNRYWRAVLFCTGIFLLFVSGTRICWISLPVVLILRYVASIGKRWGLSIIFALIGLICFIILSVPQITDSTVSSYAQLTESTSNMRKDSSEVRAKIYERTWEEITSEPDKLLLGRGVYGPGVLPGFEPAKIGSHSFLQGNLLYRQGLVGSSIFLIFWSSLITKLFSARSRGSSFSPLIFVLMSLTFPTMEFSMGHNFLILLALLVCKKQRLESKQNRGPRLYASA
jgi:hypothetical protein